MRLVSLARWALVAVTILSTISVAVAAEQESFYLGTGGFPFASLLPYPSGGEMPNFDPGRDIEPGLFLERSSLGLDETADTRYQHWQLDTGVETVAGYPTLVIWAAQAGFDPSRPGALTAYLVDCDRLGNDCRGLGSAEAVIEQGHGRVWVESRLDFEPIDHTFESGRFLGVRIVVPGTSESDMMLAYGFPHVRSRLTIFTDPPTPPVDPIEPESAPDNGDLLAEHEILRGSASPVPTDGPEAAKTPWAWVISLAFSTVMLAVLGTFLMGRLTRPGKHEVRTPAAPDHNRSDHHSDHHPVSTR